METTRARGSAIGILESFAPWIAHGVLAGAGAWRLGVTVPLALAVSVSIRDLARRRPRTLVLATSAYFAGLAALALGGLAELIRSHDALLGALTLAAVAWGSLAAGRPFAEDFARDSWPEAYWTSPLFRRINVALTVVWGAVFTLNAGLAAVADAAPAARAWLVGVAPGLAIGVGIVCSVALPRWYPRRWAARRLREQDPWPWPAPAFARSRDAREPDAVVVGAGIGGLTAGALLADRGLSVLVLDQHFLAGGFCTAWPRVVARDGRRLRYVFDAGVHDVSGLGPRGPVRHLLRRLGLEDRLEWRRMAHEYVLPDVRLAVPPDAAAFVAELCRRFPADADGLRAFFGEMEAVYRDLYADVAATGGVPVPPRTVDALLAYPAAHPHAFRWLDVPFGAMLDRYLRDPRLKGLLSALTGYLSDDPRALSAGMMAPIFGYYFDGGFYPVGSSQALADALVGAIEARGGAVRLRTPVRRIVVEGGRAAGVELGDGRVIRAPAVVSNADARRTFLELVDPSRLPRAFLRDVEGLTPSASARAVFLGLDTIPDVAPITIVSDGERHLAMNTPSLVDPALAPPGHASMTLVSLVSAQEAAGWDRRAEGYGARKRAAGDALVELAERAVPGLRARIVYRQDASPATFARYAWTTGGAIYGVGPRRPPARSPIEGLALAGAGVFPGAGVEAVVISGTLAADALCPAPLGGAAPAPAEPVLA